MDGYRPMDLPICLCHGYFEFHFFHERLLFLDPTFYCVDRRVLFHFSTLVDFVLDQVRHVFGRFFVILTYLPLLFFR